MQRKIWERKRKKTTLNSRQETVFNNPSANVNHMLRQATPRRRVCQSSLYGVQATTQILLQNQPSETLFSRAFPPQNSPCAPQTWAYPGACNGNSDCCSVFAPTLVPTREAPLSCAAGFLSRDKQLLGILGGRVSDTVSQEACENCTSL